MYARLYSDRQSNAPLDASADETEIQAVLARLNAGFHDKDAAAVLDQYAADALIFDLAPPLAHGLDGQGLEAWFDTWDGPVDRELRDVTIKVSGDLAYVHGLCRVSARTKAEGHQATWWMRLTICLQRNERWLITHDHTSVPFRMDGSFRAALDLEPSEGTGSSRERLQ